MVCGRRAEGRSAALLAIISIDIILCIRCAHHHENSRDTLDESDLLHQYNCFSVSVYMNRDH